MTDNKKFDVIIVGGSYSGLSAGMALGRALRNVLIIDSGKPCNIKSPHLHNLLTQDGKTPKEISTIARQQVEKYETVKFYNGLATRGTKTDKGFEIKTQSGENFTAKKLIFATGIQYVMPDIKGFAECWGISVIHCPYCHGYEVRNEKTGILGNGDYGYDFAKKINNWTKDLTLFTNGKSTLTENETKKLGKHNIKIIEEEIDRFEHSNGQIENLIFKDGSKTSIKALYAEAPFGHHCDIPIKLGCELTSQGFIKVDSDQTTSVKGIYACGDNTKFMRSVSNAIAMGTLSGATANSEIIDDEF